jgi:hypothetical protein
VKALKSLLPVAVLLIVPSVSFAQNNTAATAANILMGSEALESALDATNPARWYKTSVVAGRSYCAETWSTANNPLGDVDTTIAVFRNDGTTLIGSDDDYVAEPAGVPFGTGFATGGPSRHCFIPVAADGLVVRIRVSPFSAGTQFPFQLRLTDTTLNCPFWFDDTTTNFDAFLQIRNNSGNAPVTAVITAYNSTGAIQGAPATVTLPPNDNAAFALSAAPFSSPAGSGSISVAFSSGSNTGAGAPGTVSANLTSLSFSAGVGFDVPCTSRQDHRN